MLNFFFKMLNACLDCNLPDLNRKAKQTATVRSTVLFVTLKKHVSRICLLKVQRVSVPFSLVMFFFKLQSHTVMCYFLDQYFYIRCHKIIFRKATITLYMYVWCISMSQLIECNRLICS